MNKEEKLILALKSLVEELEQYDVPQFDENEEFSEDTALGYARKVLTEIGETPLKVRT